MSGGEIAKDIHRKFPSDPSCSTIKDVCIYSVAPNSYLAAIENGIVCVKLYHVQVMGDCNSTYFSMQFLLAPGKLEQLYNASNGNCCTVKILVGCTENGSGGGLDFFHH